MKRLAFLVGLGILLSAPAPAAPPVAVGGGLSLEGLEFRLASDRTPALGPSSGSGSLSKPEARVGTDGAGPYHEKSYRLVPDRSGITATLSLRQYGDVTVASVSYDGPWLNDENSIVVPMTLPGFSRGLALQRTKLYWTTPRFTSYYRDLGPANQVLLWQRFKDARYQILVPLEGDGLVGEVGTEAYRFRLAMHTHGGRLAPHHVALFAYGTGADPHALIRQVYRTAFASAHAYGRLRWQKVYPEVYRWLGWCSWNTWYQDVSADRLVQSMTSLLASHLPVKFVLIDDGWLSVTDSQRLRGYEADGVKFPGGLAAAVDTLKQRFRIRYVGVWHAFQGYWHGIDTPTAIATWQGNDGDAIPSPDGSTFFEDWYRFLRHAGIDFIKVDGQANTLKFTSGRRSLADVSAAEQQAMQTAAARYFSDSAGGLNLLNCMAMSLDNTFNWRLSDVARVCDDYEPDQPATSLDHVFQCAYNSYWLANFAWADYDMFQTHAPDARLHAVARAISGGPVYVTDKPGLERPAVLWPLILPDGRVLRADDPGQVVAEDLLQDTSISAVPLQMSAPVHRPGYQATVVAAFNIDKAWVPETGEVSGQSSQAVIFDQTQQALVERRLALAPGEARMFTLTVPRGGGAVLGLIDKYVGPAAVRRVSVHFPWWSIELDGGGKFGFYTPLTPTDVRIDGHAVAFRYSHRLLTCPVGAGRHTVSVRVP